jgi:hypothetical protein
VRVRLRIARSSADVLSCQRLIAEVYNRHYGVVFSDDIYDLDAKIEPWPHRYLMAFSGDDLAVVCGLYMHHTYVERFGLVTDAEIAEQLEQAGVRGKYDPGVRREVTKLVVAPPWRKLHLSPAIIAATHSRDFMDVDATHPPLLTYCCVRSIAEGVMTRHGIRARRLKPFPNYKVHELYRSEKNPMDSYLVIPDVDVPAAYRDLRIPGEYTLDVLGGEQP